MAKDLIIYTVPDLMRIFDIGRDKAYAMMRTDGFPSFQLNNKYFVEYDELKNWLIENKNRKIIISNF